MKSIKILASSDLWEDGLVEEAMNLQAVSFQVSLTNNLGGNVSDILTQKVNHECVLVKAETLEYPLPEEVYLGALLMAKQEGCFYALVGRAGGKLSHLMY